MFQIDGTHSNHGGQVDLPNPAQQHVGNDRARVGIGVTFYRRNSILVADVGNYGPPHPPQVVIRNPRSSQGREGL